MCTLIAHLVGEQTFDLSDAAQPIRKPVPTWCRPELHCRQSPIDLLEFHGREDLRHELGNLQQRQVEDNRATRIPQYRTPMFL